MFKFLRKRKGSNLVEYVIIAALFALISGISVLTALNPDLIRNYFVKTFDGGASPAETFTLKPMGED